MDFRTRLLNWSLPTLLLGVPLCAALALEHAGAAGRQDSLMKFQDVPAQAIQFIRWEKSIPLTAEQKELRTQVLSKIAAPCCKEAPLSTCCCPCNLVKSVWGLSNYLIVEKRASAETLDRTVREWIQAVNPKGFSGNGCSTGACDRPFSEGGCGGMDDAHPNPGR